MTIIIKGLLLVLGCGAVVGQSLVQRLSTYEVIPDVFAAGQLVTTQELSVNYFRATVDGGNVIPTYNAVLPPYITFTAAPGALYTLLFIEPDQPSRIPRFETQFLHLMIVNIPGNNITAGDVIVSYISPNPNPGSGLHRFVFTVYRQPAVIDINQTEFINFPRNLYFFSQSTFALRNRLGNPVAVNFFRAELIICPNVTVVTCN